MTFTEGMESHVGTWPSFAHDFQVRGNEYLVVTLPFFWNEKMKIGESDSSDLKLRSLDLFKSMSRISLKCSSSARFRASSVSMSVIIEPGEKCLI